MPLNAWAYHDVIAIDGDGVTSAQEMTVLEGERWRFCAQDTEDAFNMKNEGY